MIGSDRDNNTPLAQSTRELMRQLVQAERSANNIDRSVDGLKLFNSVEQLREALGWWWYVRDVLPIFGVHVLDSEFLVRNHLGVRHRP